MGKNPDPNRLLADPPDHPAIARCLKAYARAHRASIARNGSDTGANLDGCDAYCLAMPPLCGLDSIRDFIACVAHGMLADIVTGSQGARLLYAAQTAHTVAAKPTATPQPPA